MKKIFFLLIVVVFSCKEKSTLHKQYKFVTFESIENQFNGDELFFMDKKSPSSLNEIEKQLTIELFKKAFLDYNRNIKNSELKREKLPEYKNYKWLGLPLFTDKGDKIVYIVAYYDEFHDGSFMEFANWFHTLDGGNSMLQLHINLTKKKAGTIIPNGQA